MEWRPKLFIKKAMIARSESEMFPRKIVSNSLFALALLLFFFSGSGVGQSQNRSAPVEVPFEFVHNQIVVEVKIGGKGPYSMLLDTDNGSIPRSTWQPPANSGSGSIREAFPRPAEAPKRISSN